MKGDVVATRASFPGGTGDGPLGGEGTMSGLIQSALAGIDVHVIHLKAVALVMALWAFASLLLGLLLGRAWKLFGYSHTEILEVPARENVRVRLVSPASRGARILN
jgi:hypothetical protein